MDLFLWLGLLVTQREMRCFTAYVGEMERCPPEERLYILCLLTIQGLFMTILDQYGEHVRTNNKQ